MPVTFGVLLKVEGRFRRQQRLLSVYDFPMDSKPSLFIRWLCIAAAIAITAWILPGIEVDGGVGSVLLVALVLGLLNMIVRPILIFLSFPAVILSLGAFLLIINALCLSWAASLTNRLHINGFGWNVAGALVITIISTLLQGRLKSDS